MGYYELVIVVGTVLLFSPMWTAFSHTTNLITDTFTNQTINNTPSDYNTELSLGKDTMYVSLFFIIIVLFAWLVKRSGEEQAREFY